VCHSSTRTCLPQNLILSCRTHILLLTTTMQSALFCIGLPAEAHQ